MAAEIKVVWEPQPQQAKFITCPVDDVAFGGARGGGKALALDTPIPTPSGWSTMGQIAVGDTVFDDTGAQCKVTWTSPVMIGRPCYRVRFSDGAEIVADADHKWLTMTIAERAAAMKADPAWRARRRQQRPSRAKQNPRNKGSSANVAMMNRARTYEQRVIRGSVRTTVEIAESLTVQREALNHSVALARAIQCEARSLPIDAYLLGAWLGDGTTASAGFTIAEAEMASLVSGRAHLHGWTLRKRAGTYDYGVVGGLASALRDACLLGRKKIPEEYQRASIDDRLALLQGLMDTDGYCDQRGQCEFTSTNWEIASGALELIRSLGIKASCSVGVAKLNGRDIGPKYRIKFLTEKPAFRLTRKLERQKRSGFRPTVNRKFIECADRVESVPVRCIQVDSPSRLFLAGKEFTPTHNSDAVIGDFIDHESRYGEHAIALAVRRERVELVELMERGRQIAVPIGFRWKEQDKMLIGPKGGRLRFAYLENDSDADGYQGHSYTRIYPEEMGTFPSETPINKLQATLRSGHGVPCQMKGTCNPGGAGHQWVKARYRLDTHPNGMTVFEDKFTNPFNGEVITKRRVFIPSKVSDNRYLGSDYVANLYLVGDAQLVRAWLEGDWTVIAGAYFPEFHPSIHIVPQISLPNHWTRIRGLDWGSAKPFSVGWYAVSDGELPQFPRGALIKYREWYGIKKDKNGRPMPNVGLGMAAEEVGAGIRELEAPGEVQDAVADPSIFAHNGGPSIAERMNNGWRPGDNARVGQHGAMGGWDQLRARMIGEGKRNPETLNIDWRDGRPMLYIMDCCEHTIRTLPSIQRDTRRPEDVDSDGEDHAADETRYVCMSRPWIREAPQQEAARNREILEQAKFGNDRNIQQMIAEQSRRRKASYL